MALARTLGIPFYRYWKIEAGYMTPSASDREKLATYFGVDESVIFRDQPTPPADDAAAHP